MANIVGIDLGTTFSAVAKLDETGKPDNVVNQDGGNITPSVVEFTSEEASIVGEEAKKLIGISDNVAYEVKRSMGNHSVEYEFFGKTHTPTSISALILKKLKEDTEAVIGPIDSAVVTVPANFSNEAREATLAAANMAGLNIEHIINEPTAAAMAYAFQSGQELSGNFAIYDLGGGTFDCTIANVSGQEIDILTSEGVAKLGGRDFDEAISKIVKSKYKEETGKELEKEDYTAVMAEDLKKTLSSREKGDARILGEVISVSREEFESEVSNLIMQAELAVESALSRVDLKPSDIKEVILVGGSTRIPAVKSSIEKVFGQPAKIFGNPDESVALGAAIYAAYKSESTKLNPLQKQAISKVTISECTNQYFGTIVVDNNASGKLAKKVSTLIAKDEKIPCSVTETFFTMSDNQKKVQCIVTSSNTEESDPQFVNIQWEGELDIVGGRPAGQPIKVTYSYTESQLMRVSFMDGDSGTSIEAEISLSRSSANAPSSSDTADIDKFKVE